jgi:hypothetical protein
LVAARGDEDELSSHAQNGWLSDQALMLIAARVDERAGSFLQPALHKGFNVHKVFAIVVTIRV